MRTTIDIDGELLEEARLELNGKTKKAVIEEALREMIATKRRERLIEMIGTFEIDLTLDDLWKMRGCDKARASNEQNRRLPD
jgi:Arc/MetJ family transcription regulator